MKHTPIDSTRRIATLGQLVAICHDCAELLVWSDDRKEWHSTAARPRAHYLNECAGPPAARR